MTEAIVLSTAHQRLHTVLRQNLMPDVPPETLAERERVCHAVCGHAHPIDHLRLDPKILVRAEKGVVHEVPVVTGDVSRRPDGVEDLEIGLRYEAESLTIRLTAHRGSTQRHGGGRRDRASHDLAPADVAHPQLPPIMAAHGPRRPSDSRSHQQ